MAFVIEARDRPGQLDLRLANRPAHLAYVEAAGAAIIAAGPLLDDAGAPIGSLILADFPSDTEARAWTDADPYAKAGLFESVTIRPWRRVFPKS